MKNKYTQVVGQIYETNNLDLFKHIKENRDFEVRKDLVNALKENGKFNQPIMVNSCFEVIDGQNRLAAAKYLSVPIRYFINEDANMETVIEDNTNRKNWSLKDFVKSYAARGNQNYISLAELMENPSTSIFSASTLFAVASEDVLTYNSAVIRSGKYIIGDVTQTNEFIDFASNLIKGYDNNTFYDNSARSIFRVWRFKKTDRVRLFKTLNKASVKTEMERVNKPSTTLTVITDEYNKRLSDDKLIVIERSGKNNIKIKGEQK